MSSRKGKVFERSGKGLFDYMMCTLEDLRDGYSSPTEVMAISEGARTANTVLNDEVNRDLKKVAFRLAAKERIFSLRQRKTALLQNKQPTEDVPVEPDYETDESLLRETYENL